MAGQAETARATGCVIASAALAALPAAPAFAADAADGHSEVVYFLALVVLIAAARVLGELMQRCGQPAVMGQLIAGLALGPSLFGALAPDLQHALFAPSPAQSAMLEGLSQLGVLLLLLLTGMETDLKLLRRVGRAAGAVSVSGIALPFACGFQLGQALPASMLPHPEYRLVASLFLGTALSISSVKIVAMVVREMNFMRRDLGQVIVASAAVDDTLGWIIIAITFSLAREGALDAAALAQTVLGTVIFLAVSLTVGRRIVATLIRWSNDHLVSEMPVLSVILALMLVLSLLTRAIGVHTVLGAFVCGVLVGESPILTRHIDQQLRGLIVGLFMPVFFAMAGLSADLTVLRDPVMLGLTLGLVAIASIGKAAGAYLGGRFGGLTMRECTALACGMNARGSTEVIVASIGLSLGMLSRDLFTMIVAMAIATTVAMPPMLRWALARLPLRDAERRRLEREAFEANGFVANVERLLLAVDRSANGRFAARLAGVIAGLRGMPTTVLALGHARAGEDRGDDAEGDAVRSGAAEQPAPAGAERPAVDAVLVTTRRSVDDAKAAIADEARRGYDLLFVGLDEPVGATGAFHARVARAVAGFDGPFALLVARGEHLRRPREAGISILVPVTGTPASRRAAEVAVALARGARGAIAALHIAEAHERGRNAGVPTRLQQEAILKDVVALAERYATDLRTAVRSGRAPAQAIIDEVRRGGHDLVVMGVNRRPGEMLYFGGVVQDVLNNADASILLVAA